MIVYHSKLELKKWCINRDYLMYQEGMLSKNEFLKTVKEIKDYEKRRNVKQNYYNWKDRQKKLENKLEE